MENNIGGRGQNYNLALQTETKSMFGNLNIHRFQNRIYGQIKEETAFMFQSCFCICLSLSSTNIFFFAVKWKERDAAPIWIKNSCRGIILWHISTRSSVCKSVTAEMFYFLVRRFIPSTSIADPSTKKSKKNQIDGFQHETVWQSLSASREMIGRNVIPCEGEGFNHAISGYKVYQNMTSAAK